MPSSDEIAEMKQNVSPCIACMCFEISCTITECCSPLCFGSGKLLCCAGSCGLECCCCTCEPDPCYSEDRGCCEVVFKVCCCFSEAQFPPGRDIGFGCCGIGCCRTSDDTPLEE
mmetsp:Transcript_56431/g.127320  ORF Transcript_56431/g.127320 Transcript_56431/m.127320 type:complete len:114 (+) Transcript_56431:596-937(+)